MTKTRRAELEQIIREAQRELFEANDAERDRKHKDCVGKFYVREYRTGGEYPQYVAIRTVDVRGHLHGWGFQRIKEIIQFDDVTLYSPPDGPYWAEIAATAFEYAFREQIVYLEERMVETKRGTK
jgi:hypothetical protein